MKHISRKINGYTLVEMLISMIITVIVFASIMEGFSMMRRTASTVSSQKIDNREFFDDYYRLQAFIFTCDSLQQDNIGNICIHKPGTHILLEHRNSFLLLGLTVPDTLLRGKVSGITLMDRDSLVIEMKDEKYSRHVSFFRETRSEKRDMMLIGEIENKLSHEN